MLAEAWLFPIALSAYLPQPAPGARALPTMIKNSPAIAFDPNERTIKPHPKLLEALEKNNETKKIFDGLSPSKRHEIIRLKFSAGI